jgi:hypothetical protein
MLAGNRSSIACRSLRKQLIEQGRGNTVGRGSEVETDHRHAVFVSHGSPDLALAKRVTAALVESDIDAWLAADRLTAGDSYAEAIYRQLQRCSAVVVLLSPSALVSQHVRREVNACIDLRRLLLPISLTPGLVTASELPLDWRYGLESFRSSRSRASLD